MKKTNHSGLPCNPNAERMVLGFLILDDSQFEVIAESLTSDDFSLEAHQRLWRRMGDVHRRGARIDRITLHDELERHNEAESCGGLSYIISLDDTMPHFPNVDQYVAILKERSLLRKTIITLEAVVDRCMLAQDGATEVLAEAGTLLATLSEGSEKSGQWLNPGEVMQAHPGGLNGFLQPPNGGIGIPTPWAGLTKSLCGLHRGDLFLVAGRPSMGKSIVGMQLAQHAAMGGEGVAVFSLEMTKDSLVQRMIAATAGVDAQRLRTGKLDREERRRVTEAASAIEGLPLWIDDSRARTMPAITSALRKRMARATIRLVVIDHLQLMRGIGRFENNHQEFSEISHSLKHMAGQFDVTVILLSQLNRECEKASRRPHLADLKETGSLEEDADVVLFIHRPEQYNRQDPALRGQAEFIVGKQRNGPTGKLKMVFEHSYQRFVESATQEGGEE